MNARIQKLREKSQDSIPYVTHQRAELLTDFYIQSDATELSVPVRRAMAFKHIMENKEKKKVGLFCMNLFGIFLMHISFYFSFILHY